MIIESHAHYSHKRYDGTFRYLTGQLTAEEGNRDGSLRTDYPRELAELLPLLTSLWLLPSVFPATKGEMKRKFQLSLIHI